VLDRAAAIRIDTGKTMGLILSSLTIGLILSFVAFSIFLTHGYFRFPDLTTDGAFTLGAASTATLLIAGIDPFTATLAGAIAGAMSGAVTGIFHTKLHFPPTLAGILVMTALFSVNLRIMGQSNLSLDEGTSLYDHASGLLSWITVEEQLTLFGLSARTDALAKLLATAAFVLLGLLLLRAVLATRVGGMIRAAGENPQMVHSLGVSSRAMLALALVLGNGLTGLAGSLMAQYEGFVDVQIGVGMIVSGFASVFIGRLLIANRGILAALSATVVGAVLFRLALAAVLWLGVPSGDLKIVMVALVVAVLVLADVGWPRARAADRAKASS
jgi:putative ABC transport system permease protein